MHRTIILLIVLLAWVAAPLPATESPTEVAPGARLLQPFKQQLMGALQAGLAGGAPAAIEVCRQHAPAIADSLSVDGVRMGRTSHRLRNPDNAGPAWARAAMDRYLRADSEPRAQTFQLPDGRMAYVEPIRVQAQCLACHGRNLAPGVAETIAELYPADQATGFAEGDLRGAFWVEYPAP